MKLFTLLCASLMISCANTPMPDVVVVDISESTLSYKGKTILVETSRVGIGSELGSNKTPIGKYPLLKEKGHRFGPVFRLDDYQGHKRGILIHRDFKLGDGTSGCICPVDTYDMNWLFSQVESDTFIEINP